MQSGRAMIGVGAAALVGAGACAADAAGQVALAAAAPDSIVMTSDIASWLASSNAAMVRQPDLGVPGPSRGGGLGVTLGAVSWLPKLDGSIRLDDFSGFSTNLNLQGDLGLDEIGANVIWEVGINLGRHHLTVSGFDLANSDIETAAKSIVFGDVTADPGDILDSTIDIDNVKLLYSYSLFTVEQHGFEFGFSTGVDYFHIDATIENVTTFIQDSFEEHLPLPVLGLRLGLPLGPFHIGADVSGFYVNIQDIDAGFLDATVTLGWEPVPGVSLYGGYRVIEPNLNGDDFEADPSVHGPFVGGSIHF